MVFEVLGKYGIRTAPFYFCKDGNQAVAAGKKLGFPVALKVVSDRIIHKTEVGAVKVGIEGERELEHAFSGMRKKFLKETSRGILVQKMVRGIELIVGGREDPQFGHILLFGLGGIYTEYLKDVSVRVCPVSKGEAEGMVREIKSYPILEGARTGRPVDRKALVELILKTSRLLGKEKPQELDFNPVIANSSGAYVVDAKIIKGEKKMVRMKV